MATLGQQVAERRKQQAIRDRKNYGQYGSGFKAIRDKLAAEEYHWAFGWGAPYGYRSLNWNKFGMPDHGIGYNGNWLTPIYYWWIDPEKKQKLLEARKNETINLNPSPEIIFEIFIGSAANAPTISNSGLCGENPVSLAGYLSVVSITLSVELKAFDNLA